MRKKISLFLCAALAAGVLAGCGGGAKGTTDAGTAAAGSEAPAAEAGNKVITYAMEKEPETLDPGMNNYSDSSIVLQNLFTGLYQIGKDGSLTEGCAENHTVSEDGLEYVFTLKDGLKWSDGSDLTAADFEYAWKRALSPEAASPGAWYLFYIKNGEAYNGGTASADEVGVTAVDDKTLKVTLENPTSYFVDLTAVSVFFPVKKDVVEGDNVWTKSADSYVSNGAFMMKEIKPQESYELVKNPNYTYADETKLDGVKIVFIASLEAMLTAYNSGEVDVIEKVSTQAQQQYNGTEDLKSYDVIGTNYYDLNCEDEVLSDARVRKALSLSITRDTINQTAVASRPKSTYAYVPYGIPYGDTDEQYRDKVGDLFKEDVAEAQKLLAEAGYPGGEGFPNLLFITQNDQEKKDIAQIMQAMWKENLGISVDIQTYESKVYWSELSAGNFDIAYDGWTGDYPDPSTNLDCFIHERRYDENRWSGAKAEEYDAIMEENRTLSDNAVRAENFAKAEKILMDEMPIIPLYYRNAQLLVKQNCKDVIKSYIGHTLFKYADKE